MRPFPRYLPDSQPGDRADRTVPAGDGGFRAVFDCAPIGMALVDRAGRILESNARLQAMLGLRGEELQRLTLADFAHDDVVERDRAQFKDLLAGRSESYELEGRFRHRDGEEFSARLTTAPIRMQTGACALRIIEDVTVRQQLEGQLRQSQKMEAIGRLAGGLAHDFNNLLTVIKGYADGLVESLGDHPQWQQEVEAIREASMRAAELTGQLLAFGRKQQVKAQPVNWNVIIEGVQVLLSRLIPSSIDLRLTPSAEPGTVHADPAQLEQVLVNLAVYGRDVMPCGGTLTVQTANVDLLDEPSARHAGVVTGRYVTLTVTDTGAGMDEATRARIFEPFFTTKGHGRGTGLALATVFTIVQQSGGNVCVDSAVGTGTTFTVYLPRVAEPTVQPAPKAKAAKTASGHETVLLVEDQEAVRELLAMGLRKAGYTVLESFDGEHALGVSAAHQGVITALITDVVMPKLSGPDLHRRLAETRPGMKVVFMSGYTEEHVRPFAVDSHAAFLEKPFSPRHLTRTLRALLDGPSQAKG